MDVEPLLPVIYLGIELLALALALRWMKGRGWVEFRRDRVRRGTGNAVRGLQEFVQPSVEYLVQAEDAEEAEEGDAEAGGHDPKAFIALLSTALGRDPVEPEAIRFELAGAMRAGLDWRALYEQAVRDELAARPFRAPSLPPIWKVAPRG